MECILSLRLRVIRQHHGLHHGSTPIFQRAGCYNGQFNNHSSEKGGLLKNSHGSPFTVVGCGKNK